MITEKDSQANYSETNINNIVPKIKGSMSLTIVAPTGFGKSTLYRFITSNKKYRKRFSNLKNIIFLYIDLTDCISDLEQINKHNQSLYEPKDELSAIKKLFANSIARFLKIQPDEISNANLDQKLESLMNSLIQTYPNKIIYFILDEFQYLLINNSLIHGSFIKGFRAQFKGHLEYIFSITNIDYLKKITPESYNGFSHLLSHQVITLQLVHNKETYRFKSSGYKRIIDERIVRNSRKFKELLEQAYALSGGYFPYSRYLFSLNEIPLTINLTMELKLASNNLLKNLTQTQLRILRSIVYKRQVSHSDDLKFLMDSKIIRGETGVLKLFSPIMEEYFRIENPVNIDEG